MNDLLAAAYMKSFLLFIGALVVSTEFGWKIAVAYFFFGIAIKPTHLGIPNASVQDSSKEV